MYAMYCVRDLFPQLKYGVQLIFGSGEETGFDDVTQFLKKNTPPPNVFSPDAEYPVVNIEKGRFMPVFGARWEKETELPRIVSITGGKTPNIVPNYAEAVIEGFLPKEINAFCSVYSDKTGLHRRCRYLDRRGRPEFLAGCYIPNSDGPVIIRSLPKQSACRQG